MSTLKRDLYPPLEPYMHSIIKVSEIHNLYFEQCGNPKGNAVVVLHGGPGGGCDSWYRQLFDPQMYRIVLFDQRGAGKSAPSASLEENTTWDLVDDIEKLRNHLNIDRWVVFGGSWGSTLALAYAETHPSVVKALVLRGIFTIRRKELVWFYQEGANFVFPDAWEGYIDAIPEVERGDLMSAYHRRLTGTNQDEQIKCARAWTRWEMATSRLYVDPSIIAKADEDQFSLAFARIESHYFVNGGFFKCDDQLIKEAHKMSHIPGTIVQGRYDMVCPAITAWDLHKAWPQAHMVIVPDAGHSMKEPGILANLIEACEKYKNL